MGRVKSMKSHIGKLKPSKKRPCKVDLEYALDIAFNMLVRVPDKYLNPIGLKIVTQTFNATLPRRKVNQGKICLNLKNWIH